MWGMLNAVTFEDTAELEATNQESMISLPTAGNRVQAALWAD